METFSVQKELVEVDTALQLRRREDHGRSSPSSEVQQQQQRYGHNFKHAAMDDQAMAV